MKKNILLVLAMLSVLSMTGCKENNQKIGTLSAPQEIMVESDGDRSLIIFDEVSNADYYHIYINDVCVTIKGSGTGTIQFDASKIITLPQKYTIKVKAGGDRYFDSAFTAEYEYNHTGILDAPIISIDGTTLNWDKVENVEFYDVLVTTSNPVIETSHRVQTNKFDFSNILTNKGDYLFKVKAISESGEYLSSVYSNQVKYTHVISLQTPSNLSISHDDFNNETLLSFVTSDGVDNFTINIDGNNYSFAEYEMANFLYPDDISNLYIIKLSSFARYKGLSVNNDTILNISIKANTSNQYLKSSEFSNSTTCQFTNVLETPRVAINVAVNTCQIQISATSSQYLSGFNIYLNDQKYKTLTRDIRELELPLEVVSNKAIRVQSISNNANCKSSNLSDARYATSPSEGSLGNITIAYNNNILSWNTLSNATMYYVEIYNKTYRYAEFTTETLLNISSICAPNQYSVKVIAMADRFRNSEATTTINCVKQLQKPLNVQVNQVGDAKYLSFEQNDEAYGYIMYLNGAMINKLFTTSPINMNMYISNANRYAIQIKAVDMINQSILDSELSDECVIESIKTLSNPALTISHEDERYYLNVSINQAEKELVDQYEIWINYTSIGQFDKDNNKIDITSYFANAGEYNFMIKAKAIESEYVKDSNMSGITYTCTKQLDIVSDILVTKLSDESKYILTFKEQTLAAKYLVTIVKGDDENYKEEFEISRGVADISQYIVENGVYRVYVQALALEGSFYTDSATSGNPFRVVKGTTLSTPQNIQINQSTTTSNIDITWDKVADSSGYQVYVYYNQDNQLTLKKSIFVPQSDNPSINVGAGEYLCLNKEGLYTIQIKALGDDALFENSQIATASHSYLMENVQDFERNTIFMYGNIYTYKVTTIDELKNLLWYHYLYNSDVWQYNTLDYNLKIYCDVDLDELASQISSSVADQVAEKEYNKNKMDIIAQALLEQYPEITKYSLGVERNSNGQIQDFCLNEQENIYLFRYQNQLDDEKTSIQTTNKVYGEKLDIVDIFDQRSSTYVFAIDSQPSMDVTTTEQLFMAIQYNRKPNFVGDCQVAKAVYENARFILRQICSDNMNEYQKTLQIYNFLTKNITWNDEVATQFNIGTDLTNIKDFYLEGILYNYNATNGLFTNIDDFVGQASVCDGLTKTFAILCCIEGIDCIKVDGVSNGNIHSWNKVYIDIDKNDGNNEKVWYAVDIASAIQNEINVTKSGVTTTYQIATHQYFLVTDAKLNAQADSWHARLGDATDYVANTEFGYYENQRFSCVYNGNQIVNNANFKADEDTDVTNAMIYAMLKANKKHRITIDIDALEYINKITGGATDNNSLDLVADKVKGTIYQTAKTALGGKYNCNVSVTIVDARYIVIAVESVNYQG